MVEIRAHHQRTIDRLVERFSEDPRFHAVIVGGSVAKGRAKDDSDVDVVFVASDEEWAARRASGSYFYYLPDLCDYPGGYVDGKVVDLQFLRDAADHGSEPARWAFLSSFPAYSRVPEIAELLMRIPVYQEGERAEKTEAFYCQVRLLAGFFTNEAEKRREPYLLSWVTTSLVLFGCRLILAANRMLYPSNKWLMTEVESAPEKPEGFVSLAHEALERPGKPTARAFAEAIEGFRDWEVDRERAVARYIEDAEWNWRQGRPPIADW